jgi:uncharacterized membrane protein HdeD (DUF308 family)
MTARSRSGVLTAGLILICIGLLFLANNFYEISAWRLAARYWPILLIIVGVKKLYGYFTWQEPSSAPNPGIKE